MKSRLAFWGVLLCGIAFVLVCYFPMVLNPNGYLFSSEGDGLKNYYTYAYHISHDTTLSEMEGMNFPYGENFLYTDGHPILSSALQKLNTISPFIGENAVGLLNVCMFLSMVLTFPVTFLLLKKFGISSWLAILFSIAIASLAPQVFRLQGHLALSYSVSIPLSWLMYLHYRDSDKKWWWLLIAAIISESGLMRSTNKTILRL